MAVQVSWAEFEVPDPCLSDCTGRRNTLPEPPDTGQVLEDGTPRGQGGDCPPSCLCESELFRNTHRDPEGGNPLETVRPRTGAGGVNVRTGGLRQCIEIPAGDQTTLCQQNIYNRYRTEDYRLGRGWANRLNRYIEFCASDEFYRDVVLHTAEGERLCYTCKNEAGYYRHPADGCYSSLQKVSGGWIERTIDGCELFYLCPSKF